MKNQNRTIGFSALTLLLCIFALFVGAYNANGQTTYTPQDIADIVTFDTTQTPTGTMAVVYDGENYRTPIATPKAAYVTPTLWGMAQGVNECCATYLIAPLQKKNGEGKLFKATYLVGYDSNDEQILEILVTDFVLSPDGRQASVMQNGFRIDLSNRLD